MGELDTVVSQVRNGGADIALSELTVDVRRADLRGIRGEEGIVARRRSIGHVGEYRVGLKLRIALGDVLLDRCNHRRGGVDLSLDLVQRDLRGVVALTQPVDPCGGGVDLR